VALLAPAARAENAWRLVGPEGGFVHAIAVEESPSLVLYAATLQPSLLFRSTDLGGSWEPVASRAPCGFGHLTSVPGSPGVLLAGDGALCRSTDGGAAFQVITPVAAASIRIDQIEVDGQPGRVYLSGALGAGETVPLTSTDAGASWHRRPLPDGTNIMGRLAVDPLRAGVLTTGNPRSGLHRSSDAGATWSRVGDGPVRLFASNWRHLVASSHREGRLWAAVDRDLYRSDDEGRTWSREAELPLSPGGVTLTFLDLRDEPVSGAVLLATSGGLFRKELEVPVFSPSAEGLGEGAVRRLEVARFAAAGDLLLCGSSAGIAVSSDEGRSWRVRNRGLRALPVVRLISRGSRVYAATDLLTSSDRPGYGVGSGALFRSLDGGQSWEPLAIPGSTGIFTAIAASDDGTTLFAGMGPSGLFARGGEVWRSEDSGSRWARALSASFRIVSLGFHPRFPELVTATSSYGDGELFFGYLFLSTDGGRRFQSALGDVWYAYGTAIAELEGGPVVVLEEQKVRRSLDRGATWSFAVRGPDDGGAAVLLADGSRPGTLYRAAGRFWKSTDGGDRWAVAGAGLPGPASGLSLDGGALFAATGLGAYRSTDAGETFARVAPAPPGGFGLQAIAFANGNLLAGTSTGVYRWGEGPSIGPVTPSSGSSAGGTLVTVRGSGFTNATRFRLGGEPVREVVFLDGSTVALRTPPHSPGLADAAATEPDGSEGRLEEAFRYEDWSCDASETVLCLEQGRFAVSVTYGIEYRAGHAVPVTAKSGHFWFSFQPSIEVTVKVLDGRSRNGHYWVHVAALTEESHEVTVKDTATGALRVYPHPGGASCTVIDKESF